MTQSHWLRRSQKHTHARKTPSEEACHQAKVGGDIKKGAFKLSPLDSVSVITDGVLSMQPTVLVGISSPPPAGKTHSHTRVWPLCNGKKAGEDCTEVFLLGLLS